MFYIYFDVAGKSRGQVYYFVIFLSPSRLNSVVVLVLFVKNRLSQGSGLSLASFLADTMNP